MIYWLKLLSTFGTRQTFLNNVLNGGEIESSSKRCFQADGRLALIPNSWAITSADLRLANQLFTASRLNVSSNLRRVLTDVRVMGLLVHCSPNPPSVNSKHPQSVNIFEARNPRFDFRAVQFFDPINIFKEIADGDGVDLLLFVRCRDWLSFCDDVQDALDRSQDAIDLALQSAASGLSSNPQALQVALGSLRLTLEG